MTESGDPILADIGKGKLQITLSYYEVALSRVPVQNRVQYLGPEGKNEFLEKLVVESVFYLEGVRRKFFKSRKFKKSLRLYAYGAINEMGKAELLRGIKITDEQVKAEYDKTVKDAAKFPLAKVKENIRLRLTGRALERAYAEKKRQLVKEWEIKMNFELLAEINLFKAKGKEEWPKLDEALAAGVDYQYTIVQLLTRLDETPPETRQLLRNHPNPKRVLEYIVGEDLIHTWVKKLDIESGPEFEARKKLVEIGTLSRITRDEIVGKDITATSKQAREYYEAHKDEFGFGGEPPPYDAVKDVMKTKATQGLRDDATRSLAQSLMAHRYRTVYFQPNIQKHLQ